MIDTRHCPYCGHDDIEYDKATDVWECLGCGSQWTVGAPWQQFCILCGLYVDPDCRCKQGCTQNRGLPAWLD